MAETNTRQAKRTPVTLKIKFKSATLDQFIERYSVDVSHGGIFIRTKDPLAVGTTLKFEFQLRDATPLIRGEGTVVWTREHDPNRAGVAPGMGVRFDRLPTDSQEVLDKILSQKAAQGTAPKRTVSEAEAKGPFSDGPTRVAPTPLVAGLKNASQSDDLPPRRTIMGIAPPIGGFGDERTDATPLPSPVPFHSDADDFPDEAFQEKTRVAALDRNLLDRLRRDDEALRDDDEDAVHPESSGRDYAVRAGEPAHDEREPTSPGPAELDDHPLDRGDGHEPLDDEPPIDDDTAPLAAAAPASVADDEIDALAADDELEAVATASAAHDQLAARREERTAREREAIAPVVRDVAVANAADDDWDRPARSSGAAFAVVAALLLLVAGGGAYYVLAKSESGTAERPAPQAALATPPVPTPAPAPVPVSEPIPADDPLAAPTEQPAAEPAAPPGVELTVASEPSGATATVRGTDRSGTTPVTFSDLAAGKPYEVELRLAGYAPRTVTLSSTAPLTSPVALQALPRVLKISSTPAGAEVFVNGRKQPGTTPLDVALQGALARADKLEVSVRKPGFVASNEAIAADAAFVEADGVMARELSLSLEPRPGPVARTERPVAAPREPAAREPRPAQPIAAPTPRPSPEPAGEAPSGPVVASKPAPKPAPEPSTEPEPKPAAPPSDPTPTTVDEGPVPDWMK